MSESAPLSRLQAVLAGYERVVIAFSGGVDSTLLLKVANDTLGEGCHAVTCVSVTMARSEIEDARTLAAEIGLGDRHHLIDSYELERPGFAENPRHRCAMCKTELMDLAGPLAERLGISHVALGIIPDDLGDHRPGIEASRSRGAVAPLIDANLDKATVRQLSQDLGLRTWDKPQLACLSSRFPYGTRITPERLRQVDDFEDGLRALGFRQLRVRFHDTIARLELPEDDLAIAIESTVRHKILALGSQCGFTYVAVDLAGFRSGSLNQTAPLVALRKRAS